MKGRPGGGPVSIRWSMAAVSACSAIRSPSRSSRCCRTSANERSPGTQSSPPQAAALLPAAAGEQRLAPEAAHATVVDLVATHRHAAECGGVAAGVAEDLAGLEDGLDRQQVECLDLAGVALHLVDDALAEHLVAAADPQRGPALGRPPGQGPVEASAAQ